MAKSEMVKVFCPADGKVHWANKTRKENHRCTKCGEVHSG